MKIDKFFRLFRRIAPVFLILALSRGVAWARIDTATVEAAWDRMTKADGFERVPIEYEDEGGPNAWVAFEGVEPRSSRDGVKYSVHVTQEMMNALDSEEEMAGIWGHEIGHIRLGHYNQDALAGIGQSLLEVHKDRMSPLAGAVGSVGVELKKSQFSREQEMEADEYGVGLLVKAGYSPWGLHNAMKHFGTEGKTGGFDTHPGSAPRLARLAELARAEEEGQESEEDSGGAEPKPEPNDEDDDEDWDEDDEEWDEGAPAGATPFQR